MAFWLKVCLGLFAVCILLFAIGFIVGGPIGGLKRPGAIGEGRYPPEQVPGSEPAGR